MLGILEILKAFLDASQNLFSYLRTMDQDRRLQAFSINRTRFSRGDGIFSPALCFVVCFSEHQIQKQIDLALCASSFFNRGSNREHVEDIYFWSSGRHYWCTIHRTLDNNSCVHVLCPCTVGNIAIAPKVTRKVRIKQQVIAHLPILDNKPIAHFPIFDNKPIAHLPFVFCQQNNCAFPFLSYYTNTYNVLCKRQRKTLQVHRRNR